MKAAHSHLHQMEMVEQQKKTNPTVNILSYSKPWHLTKTEQYKNHLTQQALFVQLELKRLCEQLRYELGTCALDFYRTQERILPIKANER